MTNVIPLASPRAGLQVQPSAPYPATLTKTLDLMVHHQHASSAISTDLHHGRTAQVLGRILSATRHQEQVSTKFLQMEGLNHE